jgi:hypothetical protein
LLLSRTIAAVFLMASAEATDVPPNFKTFIRREFERK